jgi:hypothetical protein
MNPVLLTIPVFIAATLTLACGVLFAIIHQRDERIADLLEDKEISLKAITTMRKLYEVEIEVSKKLEADLLEADKEFEAMRKQLGSKCDEWQNKYLDTRLELDREKVDRDVEVKHLSVKLNAVQIQLNQANARTFTGRKRNNKGQFVTVAKDVEP